MDENRAHDGISLRERFRYERGYSEKDVEVLSGGCSVLEMMVGLAVRVEETIMTDPDQGNRTDIWFWTMIENMGLLCVNDDTFNRRLDGRNTYENLVENRLYIMLNRLYLNDGSQGGMFVVRNPRQSLKTTDIWYQMMWWLSSYDNDDDWCH